MKELIKQGSPDPKLTLHDAIQSVSQFEVNAIASAKTQVFIFKLVCAIYGHSFENRTKPAGQTSSFGNLTHNWFRQACIPLVQLT